VTGADMTNIKHPRPSFFSAEQDRKAPHQLSASAKALMDAMRELADLAEITTPLGQPAPGVSEDVFGPSPTLRAYRSWMISWTLKRFIERRRP